MMTQYRKLSGTDILMKLDERTGQWLPADGQETQLAPYESQPPAHRPGQQLPVEQPSLAGGIVAVVQAVGDSMQYTDRAEAFSIRTRFISVASAILTFALGVMFYAAAQQGAWAVTMAVLWVILWSASSYGFIWLAAYVLDWWTSPERTLQRQSERILDMVEREQDERWKRQ